MARETSPGGSLPSRTAPLPATPAVAAPAHLRLSGVTLTLPMYLQQDGEHESWLRTLFAAATVRPERRMRTILHDIDLRLEEGDRVALVGRNGAGKTTLLNVLTGCYRPTLGSISVSGTRQALLNVSLGFNQEATVRENILLRGTAMGIHMAELQAAVSSILDFAGLREVAHHRLGTLSAGQRMRLGFAISTTVQPDIMLLDEWIGAGDSEFLAKARQRMQDRVGGSRILVLASHSPELLKRVCNRAVVLEAGRVVFDGTIAEGLRVYAGRSATPAPSTEAPGDAQPAFRRRAIPQGRRFGLLFGAPTHCLFDNHVQDANRGRESYTCLVETSAATMAAAWMDLSRSFQEKGLRLESGSGGNMPNTFHYAGPDGRLASITLTPYGEADRRVDPGSRGRIHISCTDWPM